MNSQVQKWGNSLGIRIPKNLAQKLHLHSGSKVEINTNEHSIIITKSSSGLDVLLEDIKSSNRHKEFFDEEGGVGSESW